MDASAERDRLEKIANASRYGEGLNQASIAWAFEIFTRFIKPGPILEMGPAEGFMTDRLVSLGMPVTVVEAGAPFCVAIKSRHPDVEVVHSLFEEFQPNARFQTIILGHVLEHVIDPVAVLRRTAEWLAPGGLIVGSVPNARSIHRLAAVDMAILDREDALNDADHWLGHRRVYNPEMFRNDFSKAGLIVRHFGGYWLKPFSNSQLESFMTPPMTEAFMRLGERFPDIAAEIYVVAHRPE